MKLVKKLSRDIIEGAKPEAAPYRIWDTTVPLLFVRIQPSGIKSFNVQWTRISSRSLGKWPGVTVEAARTKARAALVETDVHGAPLAVIEASRPAAAKPLTLGAFVEDHYKPWALANQKSGQATLDVLRSTFGDLFDRPLSAEFELEVERIKSARLKAGRKPATVNRDLDRIRGVLSKAVDWGMLAAHPLRTVKRAKGADNSRTRYLSPEEERRLRDALAAREAERRKQRESGNAWLRERGQTERPKWPKDGYTDHLVPLTLLAMNCGLRRGELFGLVWESVNLPAALLTVQAGTAKSRKARHIPLNAEALAVLKRWKKQSTGTGLVFPAAEGGRFGHINSAWRSLVASARLADFRFHDCRHHFASRLVQRGVDLYTVKTLLGHADSSTSERYAHLAPAHLAAAVAKLGAR